MVTVDDAAAYRQPETDPFARFFRGDERLEEMVQHVGRKSSRGMKSINTQSVWAFHFEENDAETLHEEHQKLVADLGQAGRIESD